MDEIKAEGIVLRKIAYGDMDSIVTFLTRDGGLLTAFVSKEKVSKKRFSTQLDLFNHLSISYSAEKKSDMVFLKNADLISNRMMIRNDLAKFASLCFFAEAILAFLRDSQTVGGVFDSLISWMDILQREEKVSHSLVLLMQNHFLGLFGFKPHLSSCTDCVQPLDDEVLYQFMSHAGGIVCPVCIKGKSERREEGRFSGKFLRTLNELSKNAANSWPHLFSKIEEVHAMRKAFDFFIQYQAGKPFKTLNFLEQVLA